MNESDYFAQTCRLCLTKSPHNIDIFGEECVESSVQSKIHLMFSVSVRPDEDLPRTICRDCFKTVNYISTFKQNVENAQNTIMSLLSELARSEKCDESQLPGFHESAQERSYIRDSSIDFSEDNCEMSEISETSVISDDYDSFNESHNNHIKVEESCEVDNVSNYNGKDYLYTEDNHSLSTEQVIEFVEVAQAEDTYSPNENSAESSDSEEHSKIDQAKKGKTRKQKILKGNAIAKEQGENDSTKQSAWTSTMEEEVQNFYQFTCELCSDNKLFKNFILLCRHYRAAHDSEGYLKCCKRKMYCRSHLYQHMILHTRPEMYKLVFCSACLADYFRCPECDKQLCGPINLKQHLQVFHLPKTELPFRCSVCARGFATKTAVENHEKSQHFLSHEEKFVHECDICGKRFASLAGVSEHKKQVHEQIRPLLCDICAKSFPNQSRLRKHMTSHSNSENVKCPHCEQRLKNYGRLQVHLKRHQGVIHACQQCEKSYPTRRLLQRHIKTHSDERPHVCSICGKRYRESSHLKMHFNQHTGAMPFSCQWCTKRFSASGPFYTHRKKMHPEELARANEAAQPTEAS